MSSLSSSRKLLRRLTLVAIVVAATVIMLGSTTRLSDSGLGCPDWPTCYGHLDVLKAMHYVHEQNSVDPGSLRPADKTVPEMVHRYFASTLGLLILIIAGLSFANRKHEDQPVVLPTVLLLLVIFQGMLGMWTVTMKLQPGIVMLHLLGGFTTLTLLVWLAAKLYGWPKFLNDPDVRALKPLGVAALVVLVLQIALGGWTAANYAAVACTELPICESGWTHKLDFGDAFNLDQKLDGQKDFEHGVLTNNARTTIHVMHRFGAMLAFLVIGGLSVLTMLRARCAFFRRFGAVIGLLLLVQISLGVSNVLFQVPLPVAVAHNFGAVVLLISIVLFLRSISIRPQRRTADG